MYWKLDGHTPVPCTRDEWGALMERGDRQVARDEFDGITVSTVFLGIDHNFSGGPPLIFETMVFGGGLTEYQTRYATWDEAEAGHRDALALAHTYNDLHIEETP